MFNKVRLIGAPLWHGQRKQGVNFGPEIIRANGLGAVLKGEGIDVNDIGDLRVDIRDDSSKYVKGQLHFPNTVGHYCHKVASEVKGALDSNEFPITLGGDHSLGIGTIAGSMKHFADMGKEMAVIWVDAHLDINNVAHSPSGNIHGMPLSFLTKLQTISPTGTSGTTDLSGFSWLDGFIGEKGLDFSNLVHIGIRDPDPYEASLVSQYKLKVFTATDVERFGMSKIMEMTLDYLSKKGRLLPVHLTFDVDALDPIYAPSTGTMVSGGLTIREGIYLCETLHELNCLAALDITEVNPHIGTKDEQTRTAICAIQIAKAAAVGKCIKSIGSLIQ